MSDMNVNDSVVLSIVCPCCSKNVIPKGENTFQTDCGYIFHIRCLLRSINKKNFKCPCDNKDHDNESDFEDDISLLE